LGNYSIKKAQILSKLNLKLIYFKKGDSNFINSLKDFDRDNIPDKVLRKINKYTADPDFMPDKVGSVSGAAKSLCMWVRAMELYGQIFRVVQPKRERYNQAMALLKEKQEALADAKRKLEEVINFLYFNSSLLN
jgi:dynein heavy chain, axonemal